MLWGGGVVLLSAEEDITHVICIYKQRIITDFHVFPALSMV